MKIVFFILYRALHLNEVDIVLEWPRLPSTLKRLRYHYTTDDAKHVYYKGVGVCKEKHNHNSFFFLGWSRFLISLAAPPPQLSTPQLEHRSAFSVNREKKGRSMFRLSTQLHDIKFKNRRTCSQLISLNMWYRAIWFVFCQFPICQGC